MPRKRVLLSAPPLTPSRDMETLYAALSQLQPVPIITVLPSEGGEKRGTVTEFTTKGGDGENGLGEVPEEFTELVHFRRRFSVLKSHIATAICDYLQEKQREKEAGNEQSRRQSRLWHLRNTYLDDAEDLPEWVVKANRLLNTVPANTDEAYDKAEGLFPMARFIVNPLRFERQAVNPPIKKTIPSLHPTLLHPIPDIRFEHERHKRNTVWCLEDIRTFLRMYFTFPKKFKEIHKHLPHKTMGDLVQFYYLLKMPFRLKKKVRQQAIQFRRSKSGLEQLIETHIEKIILKVEKIAGKFPSAQRQQDLGLPVSFFSMEELTKVGESLCVDRKNAPRTEDVQVQETEILYYWEPVEKTETELEVLQNAYKKRYGKGSSDYKEYARYKEYAYGGERIQDEGTSEQVRQWTYANKKEFMKLFQIHGRNWEAISTAMDSKTPGQVKGFYETYRKKLNLDALEPPISAV